MPFGSKSNRRRTRRPLLQFHRNPSPPDIRNQRIPARCCIKETFPERRAQETSRCTGVLRSRRERPTASQSYKLIEARTRRTKNCPFWAIRGTSQASAVLV